MKLLFTFLFLSQLIFGQTWLQITDFPGLQRDDGVAVTVNDKGFFGTGFRSDVSNGADFYVMDPSTNHWSAIAGMPVGRQYACAFAGQNSFYVFGGSNSTGGLKDLYKYDMASGTWIAMALKPGLAVVGGCCLEYDDKIIIVCGKQHNDSVSGHEVWEYTISSDIWMQKNDFPFGGRFRASATVLSNTGYMMFGYDDHNHFRKEMYEYDRVNDSWTKILDFPQPAARIYASLKAAHDKLILFGGIDSTLACYKDVWYYHPSDSTWQQISDFPSFARKGGMGTVIGNTFYYSCGIDQNSNRLKETWILTLPLGIKENKQQELFAVYPNPVNDLFHLRSSENNRITSVGLINSSGNEIKAWSCSGNEEISLDPGDLPAGIYFLKVVGMNSIEYKKIVKL